jgi:2-isopropylmalate synthase
MCAFALVRFVLEEVVKPSGEKIRVDWHGHCDRGLAVANSMGALMAGAECVHACALGIGERVGNTQMDQMLVKPQTHGHSSLDRARPHQTQGVLPGSVAGHGCSHPGQTIRWSVKTRFAPRTGVHAASPD